MSLQGLRPGTYSFDLLFVARPEGVIDGVAKVHTRPVALTVRAAADSSQTRVSISGQPVLGKRWDEGVVITPVDTDGCAHCSCFRTS